MLKKIVKFMVIGFVLLVVIGTVASMGKKDESQKIKNTATETKTYKIGDVIEIKDITLTINSVSQSEGSKFNEPDDGNIFFIVNLTIENKGDKPFNSSSMLHMGLIDAEGYEYNNVINTDAKGKVDGEIGPGRKLRGEVTFEVPKEATGLEFVYEPNVFGNGQYVIQLTDN